MAKRVMPPAFKKKAATKKKNVKAKAKAKKRGNPFAKGSGY